MTGEVVRRPCRKGVKIIAKRVFDTVAGAESVIEVAAAEAVTDAAEQRPCRKGVKIIAKKVYDTVVGAESVIEAAAAEAATDAAEQRPCRKGVKIIAKKVFDTVVGTESVVGEAATEAATDAAEQRPCRKGVKIIAKKVYDTVVGAESVVEAATAGAATDATAQRPCRKGVNIIARRVFDTVVGAESVVGVAAAGAATDASSETMVEEAAKSVAEAAAEVVSESFADIATESIAETTSEVLVETATESLAEAVAQVASESVTESAAKAIEEAATVAAPVSEAVVEAATESIVETTAKSIVESANETISAEMEAPHTVLNMIGIETMNYRQVYQMMAGKSLSEDEYLEPYLASILFLVIVISLGYLLRKISKTILPGSIQVFFLEFLATMEVCSYFFENNNILKHYGYGGFFVAIVLEILISNRTFEGASENPIKALDEFSKREVTFDVAVVKIAVQALGGLASYRLAQLVWSLDMVYDHRERFFETTCQTDLAVTILLGFAVEMGAALIDTWMGKQTLSKSSFVDELIKAANGGAMIVAGVSLTGMYFNPAMATGHMLGCKGTEIWEHILVYWVGPFVGCLLAVLLDKVVKVENGTLV